jgi:uncharacterized DUF497 family protein
VKVEWDPHEGRKQQAKARCFVSRSRYLLRGSYGLPLEDETHPERLALIAVSQSSRVRFTVFAELEGDVIRIITARRATAHERRRYEEEGE